MHAYKGQSGDDRPYRGPERRKRKLPHDEVEPVVLTRKLAESINGVDLAGHRVGDRLPLRREDASLLIAEGWALPAENRRRTNRDTHESG